MNNCINLRTGVGISFKSVHTSMSMGVAIINLRVRNSVAVCMTTKVNYCMRNNLAPFQPKSNYFNSVGLNWVIKNNSIFGSKMSTDIVRDNHVLKLIDYDCIGFDLDNTLCEYNISPVVQMEYEVLSHFLVEEKGYDPAYLLKPLSPKDIDFFHKGLIVDFDRGNILQIREDSTVYRASHGTRLLADHEILEEYGSERKWEVTSDFCQNMLSAWNGPLSERMRTLLDYFDMPASLAFARIIDSLDDKLEKRADIYNVWPDILGGLLSMYKREHFSQDRGGYFQKIKANPEKYINKCSPKVIHWLNKIKQQSKILFLITGSNYDFASLTARTSLGEDWTSLFDIVVCYARKPGFFAGLRPFVELHGFKEGDPVEGNRLRFNTVYSQGNWQELYQLFSHKLNKKEPKCIYFGDNLVQDIYTPSEYTKCDTVAVVEELAAESKGHPSEKVLLSNSWGSYFSDEKGQNSVWGGIIKRHSKLCISSLSSITHHPLDHEFKTFGGGVKQGYYPNSPGKVVTEFNKKNSSIGHYW